MLPTIWPGDLVVIESVPREEMVLGDIVLRMRESRFFIHRLIGRDMSGENPSWITRGDALPHNDPLGAGGEVLGRLATIERGGRVLVPSRRLLPHARLLAWVLCHCNRFRSLALRIHFMQSYRQCAASQKYSSFFPDVQSW